LGKKAARCAINSFDGDTPVLMADGAEKPISEVEAGDEVLASDPETGETSKRKVTDVIVGEGKKELVDVTIDGETVTATDEHPFFVSGNGEWVDAEELEAGDLLLTPEGETVKVEAVRSYTKTVKVYNLTVEEAHTYYVEAGDGEFVLVHNCKKPPLSAYKRALRKVHELVGKQPKGAPGKFGSPQAGTPKKGYRLDPPHPNRPKDDPELKPHFNWWDYSAGKRGSGGLSGAIPIE
jgi:intein/homing endonuclease